jgi:RNA polymerase sigma factor (sigma-70 family)
MRRPFEEIVSEHGPTVLRVCRAVLGPRHRDDAEDAWSETFLAALRAYPRLDESANVEAWLVTIAHRKAIDITRARVRRATTPAEPSELPEMAQATDRATRPEDRDDELWAALGGLPDKQRAAVAYHYLAGLPYREIAAITGGSEDAARRAAADGIKKLRASYLPARHAEEVTR